MCNVPSWYSSMSKWYELGSPLHSFENDSKVKCFLTWRNFLKPSWMIWKVAQTPEIKTREQLTHTVTITTEAFVHIIITVQPKKLLESISRNPHVWPLPIFFFKSENATTGPRFHSWITNRSPSSCCMAHHLPRCCSLQKLHSESPRGALMEIAVSIFCGFSDTLWSTLN